jgi:hypothetical protein
MIYRVRLPGELAILASEQSSGEQEATFAIPLGEVRVVHVESRVQNKVLRRWVFLAFSLAGFLALASGAWIVGLRTLPPKGDRP